MTHLLKNHRREVSIAIAYASLLGILAIGAPTFFSAGAVFSTFIQAAPVAVVAIGMTLIIICRHIDVSVGSQFSVCGIVAALLTKLGMPLPVAAACTIGCGALLGAVNGLFIAFMGLPSIVVTLATMVILRESLRLAREGEAVRGLPATFQWFGASQSAGEWLLIALAAIAIFIAVIVCGYFTAGRAVFAVGSDREAARLAGLKPRKITFNVFALTGALVGLAALMNAVRFPQTDVNAGLGLELQVIAAVVVGGAAISGGRGTQIGTLLGVALLVTIGPALTFFHLQAQWEKAIQGLIILIAVASDSAFARRRNRAA